MPRTRICGVGAYLRLHEDDDDIGPVRSETFRPSGTDEGTAEFVLDFDQRGRLVGIEFLTAQTRLLPSVLAHATRGR
jgi:uncharacterized protein YuzE